MAVTAKKMSHYSLFCWNDRSDIKSNMDISWFSLVMKTYLNIIIKLSKFILEKKYSRQMEINFT